MGMASSENGETMKVDEEGRVVSRCWRGVSLRTSDMMPEKSQVIVVDLRTPSGHPIACPSVLTMVTIWWIDQEVSMNIRTLEKDRWGTWSKLSQKKILGTHHPPSPFLCRWFHDTMTRGPGIHAIGAAPSTRAIYPRYRCRVSRTIKQSFASLLRLRTFVPLDE
jgi:hypothetical protein